MHCFKFLIQSLQYFQICIRVLMFIYHTSTGVPIYQNNKQNKTRKNN